MQAIPHQISHQNAHTHTHPIILPLKAIPNLTLQTTSTRALNFQCNFSDKQRCEVRRKSNTKRRCETVHFVTYYLPHFLSSCRQDSNFCQQYPSQKGMLSFEIRVSFAHIIFPKSTTKLVKEAHGFKTNSWATNTKTRKMRKRSFFRNF